MNKFFTSVYHGIFTHWKTTVGGLLSTGLASTAALLAVPNLQSVLSPHTLLILGGAQAVAKVVVSVLQKDTGTVLAQVPGTAVPVPVPSQEVPNDPKVKVVK